MKLLQGTELQVLDQQAGREESGSGQGIVQTPDQQTAEPLTAAQLSSLLLQEGDAGAETLLGLDGELREERADQLSVELRSVGVDEVPALSHTRPVVLLVQVEDLEHHNVRHQSCLDSRLGYRVTTQQRVYSRNICLCRTKKIIKQHFYISHKADIEIIEH